ncbi:MAG: SMP-30/gluconolactonase/LRE family protein [Chitinophagaceae bacterium]|nr:MAG: SMP-30/gluconolactonase/LRE family protein [Chitinophagaceae bacterium]
MNIGSQSYNRIQKIADIPFYTEGPAVDSKGNLYCTTLSGQSILKVTPSGKIVEWARSKWPNGQIILQNDDHLICDVKLSAVRRFDSEGRFIRNEIEGSCLGEKIFTPNDLVADANGNIYFTDSIKHNGKIFFIGNDGRRSILVTDLSYPNGLILSRDQHRLFVAESSQNRITVIELENPGKVKGTHHVFADLPQNKLGKYNLPDGLALDNHDNIWVAHYGMQAVQVLSPDGDLLHSIDTGVPLTSNLTFINDKTLFITGGFGEPGPGVLLKYLLQDCEN